MLTPPVPELVEQDEYSAVELRTESLQALRELGPPDLVHVLKQSTKSPYKTNGVYHHVTGVDASSSASLAAYVNTLIFSSSDKSQKIVSGTYWFVSPEANNFKVVAKTQVQIPGSVESYCVDERGEKRTTSDKLWLETYLCAVLRAYSYADDGAGDAIRRVVGCRRFNPITSTESEHRFLDAAERLFWDGWQLGSDPEVQVPNNVSNHLTRGLLSYITTTGRYTSGINLFEKLRSRDSEISALLAQVYIAGDEEVKAVKLLHEAVQELPMNYTLLDTQASFLHRKGRSELALEIAKRSVIAAPSEFCTWARLAEIYIGLEQYDLALLTLNSCPMFTYQDKDAPRVPPAKDIHLPIMQETMCDDLENVVEPDIDAVQPSLRKLVAGTFKGTFEKAYRLLTEVAKKVGWDQLLKIRSQVFVMEEEYRNERPGHTGSNSQSSIAPNGLNGSSDNASTTALNGDLAKPSHTVASETAKAGSEDLDPSHNAYTSFRHKRLCERWLDNLFMVLYEDLRIFTIWRTEMNQYRREQTPYNKTAEEWEVLADLARRLHYDREAFEACQACLGVKFSPRAMDGVRQMWEKESNVRDVVGAVVRQVCWQYRWYSEFCPPLLRTVRRLIEEEGGLKVNSLIQAQNVPKHVQDLTRQYANICVAFRSSGTDT